MKFGMLLPHFGEYCTPERLIEGSRKLEEWGYDSIWVRDHLLWHPHGMDEGTFLRLTVAQCSAIQTAMAAIRRVNPSARLMQTEDVGKTFSTPELEYQAAYDNERRWLALKRGNPGACPALRRRKNA